MLFALESALAAPSAEVWATGPIRQTKVVTYGLPSYSDATQTYYEPGPLNFQFSAGVGATATLGPDPDGRLAIDASLSLYSGEWEREPVDYRASTWTVRLGVGWRQWFPSTSAFRFYGEGGGLLGWELFIPQWSDRRYQVGPGLYGRMGLAAGRGAARPTLGVKAGVSAGTGRVTLTASGPDGFQSEWQSSHAFLMAEVGVAFHRVDPAPVAAPPPSLPPVTP